MNMMETSLKELSTKILSKYKSINGITDLLDELID